MTCDQPGRVAEIAGGGRMGDVPSAAIPSGCAPVELERQLRLCTLELVPQQVAEEVVVAGPPSPRVQGNEEQVRALDRLQLLDRVSGPSNRITERRAQPLQDRRPEQKVAQRRGLIGEHLV